MLTHIVCWKYKEEASEEERKDHRAALRGLVAQIPEIIEFRVERTSCILRDLSTPHSTRPSLMKSLCRDTRIILRISQ